MTVKELAQLLGAQMPSCGDENRQISGGMVCDVMSLSIARGFESMAWVCAQININALAVAVMMDAACVIFAQCAALDEQLIEQAKKEKINVLITRKTAFEVVGQMYSLGIGQKGEDHEQREKS